MMHYLKLYAPALVLALSAAWAALSGARAVSVLWFVLLAVSVVVSEREQRHRGGRGGRG